MYNNNSLLGYAIGDDPKKKQEKLPSNFWKPMSLFGAGMLNIVAPAVNTQAQSMPFVPPTEMQVQTPMKNSIKMLTSADMINYKSRDRQLNEKVNSDFYKIGVNNDIGIPVKESIQNTTEPNWIYGGHTVNSGLMNKIYDKNGKIKYENVPWDSVKTWIDANPNIKKAYFPGCNTGESVQNLSKLPPSDKLYFPSKTGSAKTSLYDFGDELTLPLSPEKGGLINSLLNNQNDAFYQSEPNLQLQQSPTGSRFQLGRYNKTIPGTPADSILKAFSDTLAKRRLIKTNTYKPTNKGWD